MNAQVRDRWLPLIYGGSIFTSAFLLFQVQPLVSKHILPWFGGSPAVWTTCLLFFQTLLFAGYAYAHAVNTRLTPARQSLVHMAIVLTAVILLAAGLLPADRWEPRGQYEPVSRILMILTISVGLPFFALAATAPLLQAWFARLLPGRSPYRLYALSNLGSLLALVSYPFFFERVFDLSRQALFWSAGFLLYAVLCAYAAWRLMAGSRVSPAREPEPRRDASKRAPAASRAVTRKPRHPPPAPGRTRRLGWVLWPAFGSVVLLATTNRISTDIATVPFLWVVPLALYLLTFILAFDRPRWYRRIPVAAFVLVTVYGAAMVHRLGIGSIDLVEVGTPGLIYSHFAEADAAPPDFRVGTLHFLAIHFAAMFALCMLCHGELVRQRPDPAYLTSFYLLLALGGALGGVFVALVAPQIFATYFEWELSLILASLLAIGFLLHALVDFAFGAEKGKSRLTRYLFLAVIVFAVFLPSSVLLVDLTEFLLPQAADAQFRTRSFFGTLSVLERGEDNPLSHLYFLKHGAITHGAQFTHPSRRREPITYYARTSGVARAIDYYRRELQPGGVKLGVVGLGVGTLAAYADPGDRATFYEINPTVVEIADSGRWFTYLHDARQRGARCEVRLGDARLTLRRERYPVSERPAVSPRLDQALSAAQQYDVLVLDAFSGDAIPVHLLTVEAFELYLAHLSRPGEPGSNLREHGAIAVHISNRYLELEPLIRGLAAHFDLRAVLIENEGSDEHATYSADWMILTHNQHLADELTHFARPVNPADPTVLWTDMQSSLFDLLK